MYLTSVKSLMASFYEQCAKYLENSWARHSRKQCTMEFSGSVTTDISTQIVLLTLQRCWVYIPTTAQDRGVLNLQYPEIRS